MGVPRLAGTYTRARRHVATLRRRARRVERYDRAVIGLAAAWVLMSAGVWLVAGAGWALLVAGAELAAYFLLPYDVDRPLPPPPVRRPDLPEPIRRMMSLPEEEADL